MPNPDYNTSAVSLTNHCETAVILCCEYFLQNKKAPHTEVPHIAGLQGFEP